MASSKLTLWNKIGRFITGITLACFFLPFFGISCGGMDVITISGADMVGGCKPGGLAASAAEEAGDRGGGDEMGEMGLKVDNVPREPVAIIAMAFAALAFGLAWVRTRQALLGATIAAFLGVATMIGMFVVVNGKLKDQIAELDKKTDELGGGGMSGGMDAKPDAGARWGFFASMLGFIGVGALGVMALKEREGQGVVAGGPPPAAPGGYPPPPAA